MLQAGHGVLAVRSVRFNRCAFPSLGLLNHFVKGCLGTFLGFISGRCLLPLGQVLNPHLHLIGRCHLNDRPVLQGHAERVRFNDFVFVPTVFAVAIDDGQLFAFGQIAGHHLNVIAGGRFFGFVGRGFF